MSASMIRCFLAIAILLHNFNCCTPYETVMSMTRALPPQIKEYKECTSVDLRNECESFLEIQGCTVITGFMIIALIPNQFRAPCNFSEYKFPELREITGYLIFYDVRGLKSLRDMFPNLTVIRGRKLFMNYAFGMTMMPALELIEFKSLVAIQRGNVFIGSNPKLCQLERINFDRLTLTTGENQIIKRATNCSKIPDCKGCDSDYCWSDFVCQRFENDNLANHWTDTTHCHRSCLGGCYDHTNTGCVVCRGLTDHGACVDRCPEDKYLLEQFQRCYTRDECVSIPKHWTYGYNCVPFCPTGYKGDPSNRDCVKCAPSERCVATCTPEYLEDGMVIYNLADADEIRGCEIVNSSLIITIRNTINETDLFAAFASIREVRGFLKIYRSTMSSFNFLSNIRIVHGDPVEDGHYGVIIYDNKNVTELWNADRLNVQKGGIYMDRNNKLCNKEIQDFVASVTHDKTFDSLQRNDQEVLCGPATLNIYAISFSHHDIKLGWHINSTGNEVEIIYRALSANQTHISESDLDAPICTRSHWSRRLVLRDELILRNFSYYFYRVSHLKPNTRYVVLLRTFDSNNVCNARSEPHYVETYPEIPSAPLLNLVSKTNTSITFSVILQNKTMEVLTHAMAYIYALPDDQEYIDQRNYCKQPAYFLQDMDEMYGFNKYADDYDECCARQLEKERDNHFAAAISNEYKCLYDRDDLCDKPLNPIGDDLYEQPLKPRMLRLDQLNSYTIHNLTQYRLYSILVVMCNSIDCSAHSILNVRTKFTPDADLVTDLQACHKPEEGGIFHVRFNEPVSPNSLIVSYVIHYRKYVEEKQHYKSNVSCITRKQHANNHYLFVDNRNENYTQIAVRVHSLAGDVLTDWVNVTVCTPQQVIQDTTDAPEISVMPESDSFHANIFLISIAVGAFGTCVWIFYKRRCWRVIRRCWRRNTNPALNQLDEDREVLVNNYQDSIVIFRNISEGSDSTAIVNL